MAKKPKSPAFALVPAVTHAAAAAARAAGGEITLRHSPTPTVIESISAFETLIGGRQALIESLATVNDDPEIDRILSVIADPENLPGLADGHRERRHLAALCHDADIAPWQLFKAFEKAAVARGNLLATVEAATAAPKVTKEVVESALLHDEPCLACNGVGKVTRSPSKKNPNPSPEDCRACNGVGTHQVRGELKQQELVLRLAGLIDGPASITVPVTVPITNQIGFGGSLESLQQTMSGILYQGRRRAAPAEPTIDAEPLPPAEDPP